MTQPTPEQTHSLLDEIDDVSVAPRAKHTRLRDVCCQKRKVLAERLQSAWNTPRWRSAIMGTSSLGALALGLGIYLAIRPIPQPDYESADMSKMFNYTLLTNEFNKLSVEDRLDLVSQLYNRVRDMNASESAMMASFFAGVAGEAREQLEKNAGKLLVDATDMVAKDYTSVPSEQKKTYLDDAYIRLVRLTEPFDSSIANKSDEEILERGKRDVANDKDSIKDGEVTAKQASRMLVFMNEQVKKSATIRQQQRLTLFMRDMTRNLRGEQIGP